MKCPRYEAAESRLLHLKASPGKEPSPTKPPCPPTAGPPPTGPLSSLNTGAVHDKENSTELEDSGYLSLHSSQLEEPPAEEEEEALKKKKTTASPAKCPARTGSSTPVERLRRRALASTPAARHGDPNLPVLKFQQAVCEELSRSYQRNKRWGSSGSGGL